MREVLEEEDVNINTNPTPKGDKVVLTLGKSRSNRITPSNNSVSICKHRQEEEIAVQKMPQYQFSCDRCGKGLTHNNNLLQHK